MQDNLPNSITQHLTQMKNNGRAQATLDSAHDRLNRLRKLCNNIENPYEVKEAIANAKWQNGTKQNMVEIYNSYLKTLKKTWEKPTYKTNSALPFIPTEQEIDILIASATYIKTATLLQTLKETGARISEALRLQWKDINTNAKTINITASKGSNGRILPISTKLIGMLNQLPQTEQLIFNITKPRSSLENIRNRLATKLSNPRMKAIHFHTFRHWKATTEYHKCKDIMHVKYMLGHKTIECTLIYINIEEALFTTESDQWICKIAHNITESTQLIETGFEYITDQDGFKLYRKRK